MKTEKTSFGTETFAQGPFDWSMAQHIDGGTDFAGRPIVAKNDEGYTRGG